MSLGRMIFALIFVTVFYGGINLYIGRRIFQGLALLFPHMNAAVYAGVYLLIALTLILGMLPLPSALKDVMSFIGSYWMGMFVYLLLFFLAADIVLLLGSVTKMIPAPMPQIVRFCAGLIVVVLTIGTVLYGAYNANQIKHVSYELQMKEPLSGGMKIVLISDLHLGAINSEKRLGRMVREINDLKPDLVCITGDIFNDDFNAIRDPGRAMDWLKSIDAAYGVYASLGNHDGGSTLNEMMDFLEQSGIKLLNDEHALIDGRLVLIGRLDSSSIGGFGDMSRKDFREVLEQADSTLPVVVMEHNPANIGEYGSETDLILAGHTHKGQVFPGSLFTRAIYTVDYGHYQKDADSPHVIVTSGVSTWGMPIRVGTSNEIVSIVLR
jgi:predicted MPP superfamily phosphohydrolase